MDCDPVVRRFLETSHRDQAAEYLHPAAYAEITSILGTDGPRPCPPGGHNWATTSSIIDG